MTFVRHRHEILTFVSPNNNCISDWYDSAFNNWEGSEFDKVLLDAALKDDEAMVEPVLTPFTWRLRQVSTVTKLNDKQQTEGMQKLSVTRFDQ